MPGDQDHVEYWEPREPAKPRSQQRMVSRLRRRYTRVVKIGDKWNAYLQIDHQGFCVVETKKSDSSKIEA